MSTGPDHLSHLLRGGFVEDFFNWHQWYFTSEAKLSVTYTVGQFNLHLCGVNEPHQQPIGLFLVKLVDSCCSTVVP